MNERIQKMYEAARVAAGQEHQFETTNLDVAEKFAELIVRECGVALSPMLRDMISRGQAYDLIKQHFGVEEHHAD